MEKLENTIANTLLSNRSRLIRFLPNNGRKIMAALKKGIEPQDVEPKSTVPSKNNAAENVQKKQKHRSTEKQCRWKWEKNPKTSFHLNTMPMGKNQGPSLQNDVAVRQTVAIRQTVTIRQTVAIRQAVAISQIIIGHHIVVGHLILAGHQFDAGYQKDAEHRNGMIDIDIRGQLIS
jgi:hypothetical protein